MIDSDWHLELMSLGVINLISNACGAALGFGGNILFHICYSCCKTFDVFIHEGYELGFCSGDLKSVVFYITISSFSLSIIQSMTLHCDINWPLALQLGVSQQLGIAIGQFLLNTMETQWLGKILGAVFFALAIQMAYEEVSHFSKAAMKRSSDVASRLPELQESKRTEGEQENEKKKKMTILILGVGTLSGVLSGLFSTGGPPLIWLVSYLKLELVEIRATVSVVFLMQGVGSMVGMAYQGDRLLENRQHLQDTFIVFFASALFASVVGNRLADCLDKRQSRFILLVVLTVGAVVLFTQGMDTKISILIAVIAILSFLCFSYRINVAATKHYDHVLTLRQIVV